jgi:hypothetical protein
VSAAAAADAIQGYTMSILQQMAMRLCYERTITENRLRKIVSPKYGTWPQDRKLISATPVQRQGLTTILKMFSQPRFIEQSSGMRDISAMMFPLKLYVFSAGHYHLKHLACVYGEDDTFLTLFARLSEDDHGYANASYVQLLAKAWIIPYSDLEKSELVELFIARCI